MTTSVQHFITKKTKLNNMDEESLDEEPLLNGNQAARNIINRYFTFVNESSICNFPLWKLFLYSVTHVFWVLLISLPSIIIIGLISYGYSSIQWTRPCPNTPRNVSHGHTCDYYVKEAIVYGDVIVRMVSSLMVFCSHSFHSSIHSFICPLIYLLIHSLIHSSVHLSICSSIHSSIHSSMHSSIHSLFFIPLFILQRCGI